MAEEVNMTLARETFKTLVKAIEMNNWHCGQNEEELKINFGVNGEDLHMDFIVSVDAKRQLVRLSSRMPFNMNKNRLVEGAIATCAANYSLADGSFDYDLSDGEIIYRMTTSYRESVVSPKVFMYMVNYAAWAVDKFNDKFLMISNGTMNIDDFVADAEG